MFTIFRSLVYCIFKYSCLPPRLNEFLAYSNHLNTFHPKSGFIWIHDFLVSLNFSKTRHFNDQTIFNLSKSAQARYSNPFSNSKSLIKFLSGPIHVSRSNITDSESFYIFLIQVNHSKYLYEKNTVNGHKYILYFDVNEQLMLALHSVKFL